MKQNYLLDITEESVSITHTPSLGSQQLPFYVHGCGHFFAQSGYYTERDGFDNYLFIYTVDGSGFLSYKGREYTLKAGQVVLIDCNEHHLYRTGETGNWEIKWAHFNGTACKYYYHLITEDSICVIKPNDSSEFGRYVDELSAIALKGDLFTDLKLSMLMTNILTELVVDKPGPFGNKSAVHQQMVERAKDFIQHHYEEDINIKDIVNRLHASEFHLMRLFKKYAGVSIHEYLINYRISKSKALLKGTDLPVYEIAYHVGFNDVNNFIRDFKKLVGTTPLKYRNYWII